MGRSIRQLSSRVPEPASAKFWQWFIRLYSESETGLALSEEPEVKMDKLMAAAVEVVAGMAVLELAEPLQVALLEEGVLRLYQVTPIVMVLTVQVLIKEQGNLQKCYLREQVVNIQ